MVGNRYDQSDPLSGRPGGGMTQSMFINPSGGPLSASMASPAGSETGPLGGTVRGTIGRSGTSTPTRRLDAREAASKLANFL